MDGPARTKRSLDLGISTTSTSDGLYLSMSEEGPATLVVFSGLRVPDLNIWRPHISYP